MCRSSRFLVFLVALTVAPPLAEAGGISARIGIGFGARPFAGVRPFAGPHFGFRQGLPRQGFGRPGFGRPGFGRPGFGRPGFARPGFARPGFAGPGFGRRGFAGGRSGRFGRGFGNLGILGATQSMLDLDAPLPLPEEDYGANPQTEPTAVPPRPAPCIRPLIIQVGKGLRRPARTKVVYGAPPRCGS